MNGPIVVVENVSCCYTIRHASANSLNQATINLMTRVKSDVVIDAVQEVNFELQRGEVLGIIGRNGAGKSTLVKLLAGILSPSTGTVRINGAISPMIELGAGFSYELTGKENIELFGVLLGNSRKEMRQHSESIAEWAGLTKHIDFPIRAYSTGMLARLGFAVATFKHSDLLLIDEVLSVGDSEFQQKSLARLKELISRGESAILVSHDLHLIEENTSKVLWIDQGKQRMFGDTREVLNAYTAS